VVRQLPNGRRPLSELILYELMVDDFTLEYRRERAPFDAVVDKLDALAAMGVNAILFMPWTAWKNPLYDWGYEPFQYFAVESRYANDLLEPEEKLSRLKNLVSECHDRGIHVIMDGVYNHTSQDFPYRHMYRNPDDCPFTERVFGGAFAGLQDLDFANPVTGEFVLDVCRYWIDQFGIDGIRFDNTVNFKEPPPDLRGLPQLLSGVSDHVAAKGELNFSLTLEHINLDAATVTNSTAATSFWDNSLYNACRRGLEHQHVGPGLLAALNNRQYLVEGKVPTLYLSNHDHSQPGWLAGAKLDVGAAGSWWKLQPFLIALYTSTAVPMLHSGQEIGEDHFVPEDDYGTGRRVISRPLRWKLAGDRIGTTLTRLHAALGRLRRDYPALRSGLIYPSTWQDWQTQLDPIGAGFDDARHIAVYHRWESVGDGTVENAVVVLNFSDTNQIIDAPVPLNGRWTDVLAGFDGSGDTWTSDAVDYRLSVPVGSHWGRVLLRNP
jgi:pullulanase/glycogen debranching enzyme